MSLSLSWGKVYITEKNVGSDRCASAWFISRFVDNEAAFIFIEQGDEPPEGVTYDFFGADYFHKGSDCTFTTLIKSYGLSKIKALQKINDNVNDVFSWRWSPQSFPFELRDHIARLRELASNDNEVYQAAFTIFDLLYLKYKGEIDKMLPEQQNAIRLILSKSHEAMEAPAKETDSFDQEVRDFQRSILDEFKTDMK